MLWIFRVAEHRKYEQDSVFRSLRCLYTSLLTQSALIAFRFKVRLMEAGNVVHVNS